LKKALVFKWTLFANLASTALGAFLLPFLWGAVFGLLASIPGISKSDLGDVIWAAGTWIRGDATPHPWLSMTMSGVLFVLTYIITVLVEYRLLKRFARNQEAGVAQISMKQCYLLNLISYSGLIVLFALGMWG